MIDHILEFLKSLLEAYKDSLKPVVPTNAEVAKQVEIKQPMKTAGEIVKQTKGLEWCPFAVKMDKPNRMRERGTYSGGYAKGMLVHFTSGHSGGLKKAIASIMGGIKNGYTFLVIADSGEIVQAHHITKYGYHAGESRWDHTWLMKKLVGTVSDDLVGVEMNNAGKVKKIDDNKFKTWFGTYLTKDQVRFVEEKEWGCPTGYYHKYTPEQEATLIKFALWLKQNDPVGCFDFDYVLGHHEVSKGRKDDPGGSLSMPMSKFRELLKQKYSEMK